MSAADAESVACRTKNVKPGTAEQRRAGGENFDSNFDLEGFFCDCY